ncbi:MAG: hypothetical protein OSB30_02995, partial [Candidatus Poseidoniaceae archaeon]|nr:hypothetical protein [Candidatus Poseidoniaceae archaeon]
MDSKDKQNCDACKNNAGSETLCLLCQSIVGNSLGTDWNVVLSPREHEEGIELFGGRGRTSKQRWSNLKANVDGTADVTWARLRDNEDPIHSLPCSIERLQGIIHLIKEGHRLQHEERRILQIGFALHDGKLLSFLQDTAVLDGRKLPAPVPMISILTLISDEKKRIGWNISKLVSTMGSLVYDAITSREQEHYGRVFNDYRRHRMMRRRELRDGRQQPNNCQKRPLVAMLTWLQIEAEDRLDSETSNGTHPLSAWARDVRLRVHVSSPTTFKRVVIEGFDHHPKGSLDLITSPWISRWLNHRPTDRPLALKDWPLKLSRNKWQFRVRTKAGNSRLANIPEDPVIWAYLISAVLSPLESQIGLNLLAIQNNWTASHDDKLDISAPIRRSISFLNQIITANSNNVFVQSGRILVIGRLGHFYEVRVGKGAHGAPFHISALRSISPHSPIPLCIHHGRFHAQVPLGDTIASVVLSLVDDVTLADRVESLRAEITINPPFGFNNKLTPIEKPFIDAKALEQFRLQSTIPIAWYEFDEDSLPEQEKESLQNLLERNHDARRVLRNPNGRPHLGAIRGPNNFYFGAMGDMPQERRSRNTKYINATLREVSQGNPPPIGKFVDEWRQEVSFKPLNEAIEITHRMNPPYGDNWIYLRNNGMVNRNDVIGDIRNGERRWCELMPRIWQALQLQPVGSTIRIGEQNLQAVSFEHCNLRVTMRNITERRTVVRLAELLGYVEDG